MANILEDMSLAEGEAYNKTIMDVMSGSISADRSLPEQWIMSDLCTEMRSVDAKLAEETLNATYIFMRAQTHKSRLSISNLKQYFVYREDDVGQKLLASLMEFTMSLAIAAPERVLLGPFERHCGQHISIINDILSWEKEVRAAATGHSEGAALCSAVQVLASESGLTIEASKRVLWTIAREIENAYVQDASEFFEREVSEDVRAYVRGLVHQMGGNERWSLETKRYHELS
ncbi:MAG: hypothetical protein GOMPHAMPRED_007286 [Gomphillus americanus]|uniref:Terpene synthase n=1 Tax=Gomphillus americanus TaxID=1940652 RepID=A0A8H3EQS7_9LECA|nr:MAG: hypothetical protein GOMPHAMPRED_007286 [Gomphillus americanus]